MTISRRNHPIAAARSAGLRQGAWLLGILMAGSCGAAQAAPLTNYLMRPGDVIAMTVAGVPDLNATAPVDIDGKVSIPLLGRLQAAGLPLSDLEKTIDRLLPAQGYRQRTQDGKEIAIFISPQQITVSFSQYCPVYVGGDVAKPGQLTYQAGMTVGDAVAAAGGYDLVRFRANDPYLDSADLRNDYQTEWTDLATAEANAWRLRTELGEQAELHSGDFDQIPVPKSVLANIAQLATTQQQAEVADLDKQRIYLASAIKQAQDRIGVLTELQTKETAGAQADQEDLKRWAESYKQGPSTYLRYEDARRAALYSATQLLETSDSLAGEQKNELDQEHALVALDDSTRIANLSALQTAEVKIAELRSQLQATSDKILHVGVLRSQLVRGVGGGVTLTIMRQVKDSRTTIVGSSGTTLEPGDRLDVVLAPQSLGTAETQ